ncbi:histone-lysine N-methyltransferase ash1 [Drosophila rhopaloa]|uniref:Histone-lysine N-methyltransferase ash1 n=1 Tax=Drosophila rhopaloa TaxID=1041015 RepID=A0ABM5HW33_DRORH|nr:histone-lysine N-methyltransferase ash1 [Drosophila rhopaloa]
MSSGQNETAAAKVLETQRAQESGSENEETDSITDQSSQSKSTKSATQFSVQRSDTDGLRMRISAIRPPPGVAAVTKKPPLKPRKMSTQDTESGCSEARNRAVSKKVKVKRKKLASSTSGIGKSETLSKSKKPQISAFSSDSEDDLPLKVHQQRAPRLLLTAISQAAQSASKPNPLDIGISSSDNELPNLVQAAIKRVESDTEDTTVEGSFRKAAKDKNLPQYQSTLLQDFMEKTQMLGQSTNSKFPEEKVVKAKEETVLQAANPRKRRGRPKKVVATAPASGNSGPAINESADSGVISTTSTTQSTTPSPKMQSENIVPMGAVAIASGSKPKIDMAYLDKRMYATERVLYPPPRSKRRQNNKKTASSSSNKEELQLDPLWRKIDVNKKFRLRSMSVGAASGTGASTTICSKILAAKSGYVSDYGSVRHQKSSHNHNSGYKSDASCKSRYSTKSCMSRRSRAKSCGYRSDCKESGKLGLRMRRKRRASMLLKSTADDPVEDQDILQLAGLSLGQSSEESNEYISKPSLQSLPKTSASKKYGEINRYVTTGQYFGRGGSLAATNPENFISKMMNQRKETPAPSKSSCKIKSRRSSAASMCSSYVSGVSRMRRRHRRKSFSHNKSLNIDSKLLTEIEIITSTFHSRCRIQEDRLTASSGKEKLLADANKLQATLAAPSPAQQLVLNGGGSASTLPKPLKRALKKRKLSEPLVDFAMLSASASGTPNGSGSSNGNAKRRHKKSQSNDSSSPDDHKLPLKKRHYLVTPGERPPVEVAFANGKLNAEAWAAAAATAKSTASTKSQAQFNARSGKSALTPKKRHLLEQPTAVSGAASSASNSPLRIVVDNNSISGGKLLDISPSSLCSLKQQRRGGAAKQKAAATKDLAQMQSPAGSYPPPGVFEPSVELEIQIPIGKLNESVITKAEVESPLLSALDIKEDTKKEIGQRVVETLLHKTGGNLLLKRKRKKINRTGFPTVRRKKRKVSVEQQPAAVIEAPEPEIDPDDEPLQSIRETRSSSSAQVQAPANPAMDCERVPQAGEARETFVARSNQRAPRLSVVALERLQRPQTPARGRPRGRKPKNKEQPEVKPVPPPPKTEPEVKIAKKRGRQPKQPVIEVPPPTPTSQQKKTKLEPNIKLPAGIDPNTNFSCKIRLKRRKNLETGTNQSKKEKLIQPAPVEGIPAETPASQEEIDAEAEAKRLDQIPIEHDPLPASESQNSGPPDYASCSESSEDKASTTSLRKLSKVKKTYLTAGLFSNYFKQSLMPPPAKVNKKPGLEEQQVAPVSLLPPPPYCEKYLRRSEVDFELPYDIWWAYTNSKLPTRHDVPSWNYRKIRTNVYAESVRPNLAGFDHPTCNCKNQGEKSCMDNCLNRMVYTECSPGSCPAGEKCRNQKIQRHAVAPGVERFMTTDKGWGVRTKLPISKGTYILEYVGEVVTEREFKQRMASIYLNDTHHYCLHLDGGLVIDGQRMGSDCRFVNHSCEPNCEMQKWSVNGLSRMVLFAKRAIQQGEELTYDYNFSLFNPSEGQPCRCNTPQCRGVIGGKSQRVKPLPAVEAKPAPEGPTGRNGRQRKQKAKKHAPRQAGKDTASAVAVAKLQPLSEKEKKLVKQFNTFLVRNFEKIRRCKAKRASALASAATTASSPGHGVTNGDIPGRRPSTPSSTSLAAQISALCTPRNMKTRGLAQAVHDPELEKMAKMAVVLRDICSALETLKMSDLLTTVSSKKKKAIKNSTSGKLSATAGTSRVEFRSIQAQVEQGHYKTPQEYDEQMQQLFAEAKQQHGDDEGKAKALQSLKDCYEQQKTASYLQLVEILGDSESLQSFRPKEVVLPEDETPKVAVKKSPGAKERDSPLVPSKATPLLLPVETSPEEDVIRCICGLYKDEGLMIQCAKCMVWQHTECTKADIDADNYQCERCEPREVDREIPLEEFTEEGHRYYLSLMRGDLQVRQGDAVYVLRDIPIKDEAGKVLPTKKHTYETIGAIDYQECDIFRVEHLWKNEMGKRFIFGHHFLRPHETFHEPSRRFYPNEVVRVSLYEVVPIELVIGRCWVLDRTTFCKGRPMECNDEDHCYICELRVDKTARFFSKAKANHPACTKSYAFRKFPEKLKISKSYAPHDVDPSLLKTRKQKTELDVGAVPATMQKTPGRQEQQQPKSVGRKPRVVSAAPVETTAVHVVTPVVPNKQMLKKRRSRLENVLITMKLKCLDAQTAQEQPIDLSYLLSGRGARQRKTQQSSSSSTASST